MKIQIFKNDNSTLRLISSWNFTPPTLVAVASAGSAEKHVAAWVTRGRWIAKSGWGENLYWAGFEPNDMDFSDFCCSIQEGEWRTE